MVCKLDNISLFDLTYSIFLMKLLLPQDEIRFKSSKVTSVHIDDVDLLESVGDETWLLEFDNPMGSYGMFIVTQLFQIDENLMGFVQAYEHSRGGHIDDIFHLVDKKGKTHWSYYGFAHKMHMLVVDKSNIWVIHRDFRKIGLKLNVFTQKEVGILAQIKIANGEVSHKGLVMPRVGKLLEEHPSFLVCFIEEDGIVCIVFHYCIYMNEVMVERKELTLPFNKFIKEY